MTQESNRIPNFDDIVFKNRNRDYSAYLIRKKNPRDVITSILIGSIIMTTTITVPYISAKNRDGSQKYAERQVEIKMENLNQPNEIVLPAPPPPPPSVAIQQTKYIPPVVVDSVNPQETEQLITADEAQITIQNEEVVEIVKEVKEEVKEEKAEPEPFLSVEEMPEPPGGETGLYKYIAENTIYPERAHENNIQGKVFVRFCVTSKGNIEQVSIYKSVDPELDAEAIRVVETLPRFKPGKQSGIPVPVWFLVHINFQLK
jgi:periplasmic protein TonB